MGKEVRGGRGEFAADGLRHELADFGDGEGGLGEEGGEFGEGG